LQILQMSQSLQYSGEGFISVEVRILMMTALAAAAVTAVASTRPAAVAGAFYTDDASQLRAQVEAMLAAASTRHRSLALVVPHAGYPFSGAVAGEGFATLDGAAVRRVILLGPSHHTAFVGGALPKRGIDAFATPLGDVKLDLSSVEALRASPDFAGPSSAQDPEHSLEVELPFLQVVAPNASIVPILVGNRTDTEVARRMAKTIAPLLDEHTAVVVSSDFTHHGDRYGWTPFAEPDLGGQLVRLGQLTAGRLAAIDPVGFTHQVDVSGDTVCGVRPATVLAELLAHAFDGSGVVLDVTTSGYVTGDWDLSVTYAAIAFRGSWRTWRDPDPAPPLGVLTAEQGAEVVSLARAALESFLRHDGSLAEWYAGPGGEGVGSPLAGAFVTLNHKGIRAGGPGRLRACMGVIEATQPLGDAVVQAAVWAAQDPRFPRLTADELDGLDIEVSVLSPAHAVAGPGAIEVGTNGVILTKGVRRALFLPQVATEQGWDRTTMLDHLALKAGLPANGWRDGASFEVFTAQVFGEGH
jgi:AmmeMemoRadiSam system protein B/AmmeMemoRadiSam system protein A